MSLVLQDKCNIEIFLSPGMHLVIYLKVSHRVGVGICSGIAKHPSSRSSRSAKCCGSGTK